MEGWLPRSINANDKFGGGMRDLRPEPEAAVVLRNDLGREIELGCKMATPLGATRSQISVRFDRGRKSRCQRGLQVPVD